MLQSMGSQRAGHDWSDVTHTHACTHIAFFYLASPSNTVVTNPCIKFPLFEMSREMWGSFPQLNLTGTLPTMAENAVPQQTVLLSCSRKHSWSLYLNILLQPFFSVIQEIPNFLRLNFLLTQWFLFSATKPTLTEMTGFWDSKTWSSF